MVGGITYFISYNLIPSQRLILIFLVVWFFEKIAHHIAGTKDPISQEGDNRLGPTEIITRKVAKDLGWRIQESRGYMDDERTNYINIRNFEALLETVGRYQGQEQVFFGKTT